MEIIAIIRNILVRVGANITPFQRNMATAQRSMGGWQTVMRTATANTQLNMQTIAASLTMGRLGFIALGAAAVAAFAIVSKNAIKAAMDVVESESLFTVSMGSMGAAARAWSEQLQASLGLNAYEVRRNVGVFYNMTTSMGLARDAAYKLSTDLTKLAYDMSSFYNMPVEEMFIKLQSGITGETEPLKSIGILVLDNVIKQYAYAEGIANVGAELTEQQKVMARYIAIMAQTRNAQGDLARTITSPSNQLRLLRMQLDLARINLGNAFMPIVTIVLPILTGFAKSLVRVTNTFAQFMSALFGSNNAQAQSAQSAADAAAAQGKLGDAAKKAGDKAKKGVAGFDQLNLLQENLAASASDAADALGGESTMPTPAKDGGRKSLIPKGILDAVERTKKALKPLSGPLGDLGESLGNLGRSISENPIIQQAFKFLKEDMKNLGTGGIYALGGALEVLSGVVNIAAGAIGGNFETALKGAEQAVSGTFDIVTGIMYPFFPEIAKRMQEFKKDFGEKWESLKGDVKKYGDPTKLEAMDFAMYIRDKVSEKWGELKVNTATKWGEIKTSISEKWELIKSIKWDDVKDTVSTSWDSLKTSTATKWDGIKTTISEKWESIKTGIGWDDLKIRMDEMWDGVKNIFKEGSNGAIGALETFLNLTIKGFNKLIYGWNITKSALGISGWTMPIEDIHIPRLANGGLVSSPTLAMVGDNKQAYSDPEVVSPLSKLQDMIDKSISNAMSSNRGSSNASDTTVILKLGESELGRAVIKAVNSVQRQAGMTLLEV